MSETAPEWVDLRHPDLETPIHVANDEVVLDHFAARGWEPYTPDEAAPFVPAKETPAPSGVPGDRAGFVELVHPDLPGGGQNLVPNTPEALAGAALSGWVEANRDGSTPAPATARARARKAAEAVTPSPVADEAAETSTERPGDTAATDTKEQ
jgi:hypothetical protein